MKTRQLARCRLDLHRLEDKVLPAASWPFAGGPATNPVIGTYGQYQDFKSGA